MSRMVFQLSNAGFNSPGIAARLPFVAAVSVLVLWCACSKQQEPADGEGSSRDGAVDSSLAARGDSTLATSSRTPPALKSAHTEKTPAESEELTRARDATVRSRVAAEAVNAQRLASEEYQAASMKELEAATYATDGDAALALTAFQDAEREFRSAERSANDSSIALREVEGLTASFEALRKEAAILKVEESTPELWKSASDAYERSKKCLEKANFAPRQAKEALIRATADLKTAIAHTEDYSGHKDRLMKARSKVYEMYSIAGAAEIERYASVEYGEAVAEKGRADRAWEKREYLKALGHFEQAAKHFEEAFAVAEKKRPPEDEIALVPRRKEGEGTGGESPGQTPEMPGDSEGGGGGGEAAKGPSDAEIAVKLATVLHGNAKYERGILSLSYEKPSDFQLDCEIQPGTRAENVLFDVHNHWRYWRELFAFAGHTGGHLLHNVPFDGDVTVKAQVEFDLLVENPEFQLVLNSDGRSFCASQFCTDIRLFLKGKPKGVKARTNNKDYQFNPNKWVPKGSVFWMEFRYDRLPDSPKGTYTALYRGTKCAEWMSEDEHRGRIGFVWTNAKFIVVKLEISGQPDAEWLQKAMSEKD